MCVRVHVCEDANGPCRCIAGSHLPRSLLLYVRNTCRYNLSPYLQEAGPVRARPCRSDSCTHNRNDRKLISHLLHVLECEDLLEGQLLDGFLQLHLENVQDALATCTACVFVMVVARSSTVCSKSRSRCSSTIIIIIIIPWCCS